MQAARSAVASFLGAADEHCISFGQNMTTLNFALATAIGRTLVPGDEVLITQLDHEANRGPWLGLRERGVVVQEVRLLASGVLDADDLAAKIGPRTRLLALGASSNALGTVNDIALARRLTRAVGALLVIDAVHYAPHFPVDVAALGVDFLLCSAYKFYGPHVGILYSAPGALARSADGSAQHAGPVEAPYPDRDRHLESRGDCRRACRDRVPRELGQRGELARTHRRCDDEHIAAYEHGLAGFYYERVKELPGIRVWGQDFSDARAHRRCRSRSIRARRPRPRQHSARKASASGTATSMPRARSRCWASRNVAASCAPAFRCTARGMSCNATARRAGSNVTGSDVTVKNSSSPRATSWRVFPQPIRCFRGQMSDQFFWECARCYSANSVTTRTTWPIRS
jgi:selenocysteine lyase/cysteine desulfurase